MHLSYSYITALFIAVLLAVSLSSSSSAKPELPPHPRLLFTSQGITEMKERIAKHDWARVQWDAAVKNVDKALEKDIVLPPRGGNWTHWYACPEHGTKLQTGKQIGEWTWEHICPTDKKIILSDPSEPKTDYDGCVISNTHNSWSKSVLNLGIAYRVTGDMRYADKARRILLAYADRYKSYTLHNIHGKPVPGGGKIFAQSLDESVWLIPVCQGADLIWDTLSDEDRKTITDNLLLPSVQEVIQTHDVKLSNVQAWKNSAVGCVGFLIGDWSLIQDAIYSPGRGFKTHMRKGVLPDGGWWEGAWSYHFYTMSALWPLAEAARNCGINLYEGSFKKMFDAPFKFAMPNLTLPAFSDSNGAILKSNSIFELGYARYNDPKYLSLLNKDKRSHFGLWFGPDTLPNGAATVQGSANYPDAGYAILSQGKGEEATWLCMKYGPYGGGHGHPDKLSFILYARGQVIGVDPGTCAYGLPAYWSWYRSTIAHNTLTVDGQYQNPVDGKLVAFGNENGVDYVIGDAGDIYDGVSFIRTAAMLSENLVVFIDHVQSDSERLLDIAYHQKGKWDKLPKGDKWTPDDTPGYNHFSPGTIRETSKGTVLRAAVDKDWKVSISLAPGEETKVITAKGMGSSATDRVPVCVFRRSAKDTAFAWCISLDGEAAKIEHIPVKDSSGQEIDRSQAAAVKVTDGAGSMCILVSNPHKKSLRLVLPDGSELRTDAAFTSRRLGNAK